MIMTILFTRQLYPGPSPGGHFGYLLNMGVLSTAVITLECHVQQNRVPPTHPSSKNKVQGNPENTKTQYDMHPISGNIASQEK